MLTVTILIIKNKCKNYMFSASIAKFNLENINRAVIIYCFFGDKKCKYGIFLLYSGSIVIFCYVFSMYSK